MLLVYHRWPLEQIILSEIYESKTALESASLPTVQGEVQFWITERAVSTLSSQPLQTAKPQAPNHCPQFLKNNDEGLPFAVDLEFPIMAHGSQFVGSEGAGWIGPFFDQNCNLAGTVMHTGPRENNFYFCLDIIKLEREGWVIDYGMV